jgi:hypothetical protein
MATPSNKFTANGIELEPNFTMLGNGLDLANLHVISTEHTYVSSWQLSPEELELVQKTGRIYIAIWGIDHPPISVTARLEELVQV